MASSRALVVLVALFLLAPPTTPTSGAQETEEAPIQLDLIRMPLWHEPDDGLGLTLRIDNRSVEALEGYQIEVSVSNRVLTRSDLHLTFDDEPAISGSAVRYFRQRIVGAGSTDSIEIDPPLPSVAVLAQATESGVYPLTLTLADALGRPLDSLTTQVIYFPDAPETPLRVAPVVPFNELPARDPAGTYARDDSGAIPLEIAISEDGWLTHLLAALDDATGRGLRVGVAPTPRLLEELSDMSDGYRRGDPDSSESVSEGTTTSAVAAESLQSIRELLERGGVQPLVVPYSFPDLPTLGEALTTDVSPEQQQVTEAGAVLQRTLGLDEIPRWLYPPGGRVDRLTLDRLRGVEGAEFILFSHEALDPAPDPGAAGCPREFGTFGCPVAIEGAVTGLVTDADIQERMAELVRPGETRADAQRLFAEIATIREEAPADEDRVIHVIAPAFWHPRPRVARLFLSGFARAPWLRTVTPSQALSEGVEPAERGIVEDLPPPPGAPEEDYYEAIQEAQDGIATFRAIGPPLDLVRRLQSNILVAQSRAWWGDIEHELRGRTYATATLEEARAQVRNIRLGGSRDVTLTSREGAIQVLVTNENDYPVTLRIVLDSPDLTVDEPQTQTFPPGTTQVNLDVRVETSGNIPVDVRLETSAGDVVAERNDIEIRSTALNQIALIVTFGALGFLILFYAFRAFRGKGSGGAGEPNEAPAT